MDLNDPFDLKKYLAEAAAFQRMLELADPSKSVKGFADEQKRIHDLLALSSSSTQDILARIKAETTQYDRLLSQVCQFEEHLKALQKSVALDSVLQAIRPSIAELDALNNPAGSSAFAQDLDRWNARAFPDFQINWETVRARFARSLAFAAKHGWFLPGQPDADPALPLEDCGDDIDLLDEMFENHVEDLVDCVFRRS